MCLGVLVMEKCFMYKDVPRHVRFQGMLVCVKACSGLPRVLRSVRSLSLIEMVELDYVLNNIVPKHTSGTLSKGNLLDNKPNKDESCIDL